MDVVQEAPDVIIQSVAPITGTRHRILLLWTLAGATYLVKIPPRKERLESLLCETTSPRQQSETDNFCFCCAVEDVTSIRMSRR